MRRAWELRGLKLDEQSPLLLGSSSLSPAYRSIFLLPGSAGLHFREAQTSLQSSGDLAQENEVILHVRRDSHWNRTRQSDRMLGVFVWLLCVQEAFSPASWREEVDMYGIPICII